MNSGSLPISANPDLRAQEKLPGEATHRRVMYICLVCFAVLLFACTAWIRLYVDAEGQEALRVALKFGQLAPVPKTAQDLNLVVEGSMFTRSFRGSFTDTPARIKAWLEASAGVREGHLVSSTTRSWNFKERRLTPTPDVNYKSRKHVKPESVIYRLKPGDGAQYGELIVSPDGTRVDFYVSWS